jgi:hypothetical protein
MTTIISSVQNRFFAIGTKEGLVGPGDSYNVDSGGAFGTVERLAEVFLKPAP